MRACYKREISARDNFVIHVGETSDRTWSNKVGRAVNWQPSRYETNRNYSHSNRHINRTNCKPKNVCLIKVEFAKEMIKRARDLLFQRSIFSIYIEYLIDNLEFQLFSLLVSLFVKFNIENDTEVVAKLYCLVLCEETKKRVFVHVEISRSWSPHNREDNRSWLS